MVPGYGNSCDLHVWNCVIYVCAIKWQHTPHVCYVKVYAKLFKVYGRYGFSGCGNHFRGFSILFSKHSVTFLWANVLGIIYSNFVFMQKLMGARIIV